MDLKVTQGDLYRTLPEEIIDSVRKGPNTLVIPKEKDEFINEFLKKTVPKKHHKAFLTEKTLKYQRMSFVATKTEKKNRKKLNDFQRGLSKKKQMTAREKRDLGLFDIPTKDQQYHLYIPLHEVWKDYIRDTLSLEKVAEGTASQGEAERRLLKADYHGAILIVLQSKCTSLIGQRGIVLMETKRTFKVITTENVVKIFPKAQTVFVTVIDGFSLKIYGKNFMYKPADRTTKKFKGNLSITL